MEQQRSEDELTLRSEFLMDYLVDLDPPCIVGSTPHGGRQIYAAKSGWFEGPRLKGKFVPPGGDWLMVRPDGILELDVRASMETNDGALIYVTYYGLLKASPEVLGRFGTDRPPRSSEFYFRTCPRFETGDPRYQWLNEAVCVAIGNPDHIVLKRNQVAYRVFRIL
jgi:uncharacterized protein DUF3237